VGLQIRPKISQQIGVYVNKTLPAVMKTRMLSR